MDLMAGIDDDDRMAGAALGNDIFAAVSKATGTGQSGRMAAVAQAATTSNPRRISSRAIQELVRSALGLQVWDKAKGGASQTQ